MISTPDIQDFSDSSKPRKGYFASKLFNILNFMVICLLVHLGKAITNPGFYGTGVALSSDYGTISAYFPNDTYLDIAKIEGGEAYKAYMLGSKHMPSSTSSARYCPLSQNLCHYWPLQNVQAPNPLAGLLKALMAAADAGLETHVRSAHIGASAMNDFDEASNYARSALDGADITIWRGAERIADHYISNSKVQKLCDDPHETTSPSIGDFYTRAMTVLMIEYTKSSMKVSIGTKRRGEYDIISRARSSNVAHDAIAACMGPSDRSTSCDTKFEDALRDMIVDADTHKNKTLGAVLIFGEKAHNKALRVLLRESLKQWFANGALVKMSWVDEFSPDPAFAGARMVASSELKTKEWHRNHQGHGHARVDEL